MAKGLLLALAAAKKKPAEAMPEEEAPPLGDGLETAMGELMDALKSGDTVAAAEALRSAASMCRYDEGGE